MTPTSQESVAQEQLPSPLDGERVVISGMSGLYPSSKHVKDLEEILYSKKNVITEENCRWKFDHPEVSNYTGKIPNLDRFDGQFFKVHYRLGNSMDAMSRKMLEQAYQAIYDAGISPEELSGKKVGVYTGTCFSETEKASFYLASSRTGFSISGFICDLCVRYYNKTPDEILEYSEKKFKPFVKDALCKKVYYKLDEYLNDKTIWCIDSAQHKICSKSMFANRISYWLNGKGPSLSIDDACCSSICALEQAYLAISRGECEAAIVAGANLSLHPQSTVHYSRIMTVSTDGKTKSFDHNAKGVAKSEAINVLFLQKAKHAKRVHAEVLHVKTEFTGILESETGPRFGFYRDPHSMAKFLKQFYKDANVPPQLVQYVEAFGSAVPEADKAELEAIEEVFCKNRSDPVLVGSVMSNIGYGEAASGISAITKVILGYRHGKMAANLHIETPRQDVKAVKDGRIQILADHREFDRAYTAVNQISVTGVNAHVLLHGHYKPKDPNRYKSAIPHLVTISGRQDSAVKIVLDDLKSRPIDPEELALFHNIHQNRISGHMGRGYTILSTNEEGKTISLSEQSNYFDNAKRPLWFVYSGMGSQWPAMGAQLMKIPIFAAAIEKCRKVLEPKGVDIVRILTNPDKTIFDNILHSFVGIAAVQIGLTDVLTSLGIVPDKIIGHSVGELGCAYADGCFTAEEMILSAYSRGLVSVQTPFIKGSMAAVGLGYQQIVNMLPPEIEVACHNGPESSTISGPADVMKQFVAQLTEQGVFAREVPCSNIAYHSRYIAEAGPGLLNYLSEVIKNPKARSKRWVSSSVPEDRWHEPLAKYSSAQYHTNNLLSSVLFEETSRRIPANAVCIEIAPHGLLQAILKRSLPESCKHIPMTRRGHQDNTLMVLDAVGKLYMEGFNPKVQNLYPPVEFPVSTETPLIGHLVEWAHNERWTLPLYMAAHRTTAAAWKKLISLYDDEHAYLRGHVIKGKNLCPFAAALIAVWDTFAMFQKLPRRQVNAEFRDVQLFGQPTLLDRKTLKLSIALHRANGRFEVLDEDCKVATGFIKGELHESKRIFLKPFESTEDLDLTENDVYQILHDRDYFYRGDFRSIKKVNKSLTEAEIAWNNNWVTYLDGILQLHHLRNIHNTVTPLFQIRRISIDVMEHNRIVNLHQKTNSNTLTTHFFDNYGYSRSGGVIIENVQFHKLPIQEGETVALKSQMFVPRFQKNVDLTSCLQVFLQIVVENINKNTLNILGVLNTKKELPIFDQLRNVLNEIPGVTVKYAQVRRDRVLAMRDQFLTEVDVVLVQNLSTDDSLCQMLYRVLRRDTFLINGEQTTEDRIHPSALFKVVSSHNSNDKKLDLVKWRPTQVTVASTVVNVRNQSKLTLLQSTRAELPPRHKLVILATYPSVAGLKDLVKQWRKESDRNLIYLIMVSERDNLDQLPELDLAFNVLVDGVWGGEYNSLWNERAVVERGVTLRSSRIGALDSLYWVEAVEPAGTGIAVNVHFTTVTNRDVKKALGVLPLRDEKEPAYCMDFSGVTDDGQRVMGVITGGGAASGRVRVRPELAWPVPAHWSLEDAVTVPSAYILALYCLAFKVQFRHGLSVLVHGATGAPGQAAISIALAHGCEVFATISDVRKKRFLMTLFPQLPENHIGNSRDASFGDMVRNLTKGEGCNIVISNVKRDLKNVSLSCLSCCGIMLDTVQLQDQEAYIFGMSYLTKDRNYVAVDLSSLVDSDRVNDLKKIQILISEGIARGYVRPLSRVTYAPTDVSRAFRLVAGSRHRGRVVLRLQDKVPPAEPRLTCSPELTQVVVCDKYTFGQQLAQRLIDRGARKLVVHSIRPSKNLRLRVQTWENIGVKVQVSTENLSNTKGIIKLLSESNRLGPVEGIFILATDTSEQNVDIIASVIANLDLAARKLCPSVKYFAVVNAGLTVGQQTSILRNREGVPATLVNIPDLRKPDDSNPVSKGAISWRGALNALERALRSSHPNLLAHQKVVSTVTLLQQIASIAEIEIPEETNENVTLIDLGVELHKVPVIISYLTYTHDIVLEEETVVQLSVQKIRELEEVIYGAQYPTVRGLHTFFSYVDPDELAATSEISFLPTLTNSATVRQDEFDTNQMYLSIIPGLEGHHQRFQMVCERLKMPALILQPGLDNLNESLADTAERYAKMLMKKVQVRENFFLLGYESGVYICLEVAAILEENGITGTVFCLGGTPEEIHTVLEKELNDLNNEEVLQNAIARHMYSLMSSDTEGVDQLLKSASSWKDKVELCVRSLLGKVAHSAQYTRNLIEAAYTRVKQARAYNRKPRQLKSKLVLLHASSLNCEIPPEQLLQKYSQQPVSVHELHEPLAHCTKDLRCSSIINRYLDSDIIKAFNERNHCDTYLLNADTFMMNSLAQSDD